MGEDACREATLFTEQKRYYLNIMKGIAIFLMLWGHAIQCCAQGGFDFYQNSVFKVIYSFHMPLFMIISGYLFYFSFEKRELRELIIHRSKPLLWTIFACSAFNYVVTHGIWNLYFDHTLSHLFSGNLLSQYKSLWFLWSVLAASIGVAIICKKVQKVWLQLLLLLLWGIVVYAFPNGNNNVYVYPYFVIGFYYAKYGEKVKQPIQTAVKILSIALFVVLLFFYEKKHYIYTTGLFKKNYSPLENLEINLFRFFIGLVGCIAVLSLVHWIFSLITSKSKRKLPLSLGLSKLGEKSLQIYALSVAFLSFWLSRLYDYAIGFVGYNFLAHNIRLYNFVYTPLIAILYAVGLYWLIRLFEKIKFSKILFGK